MSGFIGKPSSNQSLTIPRSGFWPSIDIDDFRKKMRVLDSVANEQAEMALMSALDSTIYELASFEENHSEYDHLEDVPSKEIAGRSSYVYNFERAVYAEAKAQLLEEFFDMDLSRKAGEDRAATGIPKVAELRKENYAAIQTFFNESAIFVELV